MFAWQKSFRDGIAPNLSTAGLIALKGAIETDDASLIQGETTSPPPLDCCADKPVKACCAIAYAVWKGDARSTVSEVEEAFARVCYLADQALGEPAAVRWFVNWFDETPRATMRRQLLAEVNRELAKRGQQSEAA
jgi:hypothetical protein